MTNVIDLSVCWRLAAVVQLRKLFKVLIWKYHQVRSLSLLCARI